MRAALSGGTGWPSASSPTASPWTAKPKSSSRPASSSTSSRRKRRTRSAHSWAIRGPARTARRFRRDPAADGRAIQVRRHSTKLYARNNVSKRLPKRIFDFQVPNPTAMLHVFAVQNGALRLLRRRHNQRIVPRELVLGEDSQRL